jgi:hypothetical protein
VDREVVGVTASTTTAAETPVTTAGPAVGEGTAEEATTAPEEATTGETTSSRGRDGPAPAEGEGQPAAEGEGQPAAEGRGVTIPIPVVTPHLSVYRLHVPAPGVPTVGEAGRAAASHVHVPGRVAFYGGLGAAAVFGVIEWPVAAAIGLGTAVARRARSQARPGSETSEGASESGAGAAS